MRSLATVILLLVLFVSCKNGSGSKTYTAKDTAISTKQAAGKDTVADTTRKIFGARDTVIADVDGDNVPDTLVESYKSSLTGRDAYKTMDSADFDKNVDLISQNEPVCKLYGLNRKFDSLLISDIGQQKGVYFIDNLKDLNGDGGDELGYVVDYADWSNINSYHIASYNKHTNKWEGLADFSINEGINFEPENLYNGKSFVKKIGPKKIKVMYYTDEAEVGEKTIIFK